MANKKIVQSIAVGLMSGLIALSIIVMAQASNAQSPSAANTPQNAPPNSSGLLELPSLPAPSNTPPIMPVSSSPPQSSASPVNSPAMLSASPVNTAPIKQSAFPAQKSGNAGLTPLPIAPMLSIPAPVQSFAVGATPPSASIAVVPADQASENENNAAVSEYLSLIEIIEKNPGFLLVPTHMGDTSILFSKEDMETLVPFIELYDKASHAQKTENTATDKPENDNRSLLSLLPHEDEAAAIPLPLPNLYLGSIVYYSPSHWSVWINGKKLMNTYNVSGNEFYISRISRAEIELVWKPHSLLDTPSLWQKLTNNGKNPIPNIMVDESKGEIILQMYTNQTFLPRSLAIREGLIKSNTNVPMDVYGAATNTGNTTAKSPQPLNTNTVK